MWKTFWIAAGTVFCLLAGVIWVSANSTFLYVHPRAKDVRIVIDYETRGAVIAGMRTPPAEAPSAGQKAAGVPRAEAPEREFDFGTMNPLTMGRHDFVVKNVGQGPLKLRVGSTTCKCTVAGLKKQELAPGEATTVALEWNTGRDLHYAHSATILTNDPENKSVELRVQGRVSVKLGFDFPEVVLQRVAPDKPVIVERIVYSQIWEDLAIENVETKLEGLTWEASSVSPQSVPDLHAKSAQRLRFTLPACPPEDSFQDTLRLTVRLPGQEQAELLELPLAGTVTRRLAVYGPAIDAAGVIDLGHITEGQGNRVKLVAKVRDIEPELPSPTVEILPKFLTAAIERHGNERGLYDVTIELPKDAPACQYLSNPIGRLRIDTGHPRIGVVELKVIFAVIPRQSL